MNKNHWLLVGGVLLGVIVVWGLMGGFSPGIGVDVVEVRRDIIWQFIDEQAVTRLPETHAITMPFAGRIEPIRLVEGTPVRRGQTVAQIVPRDLELAVEEAQALVGRLQAAIEENADVQVEKTAAEQAEQYKKSMEKTVDAAQARTQSGKAAKEFAERRFARVDDLFKSKTVSEEDRDRALLEKVQNAVAYDQDELVYAAMKAMQAATNLLPRMIQEYIQRKGLRRPVLEKELAEAQARLEQVKLNRQRGTMTSPVDGVVLSRAVSNERFLPGGTVLLEIGRLEELEVEADVLSVDVGNVKKGQEVEIYGPAVGKEPIRGTVHRVYPAGFTKLSSLGVEQQRVKVVVRFGAEDLARMLREGRLGVGYRVRVRIFTDKKDQALVVPRSALFRSPAGRWQLFVVRNGRARVQPVEVGILNDERAEVSQGLEAGDLVLRNPESTLVDGQRVRPIVEEPMPEAGTRGPG